MEFPFNKDHDEEWPEIVIPKGAGVDMCAKALLMRAGSYEAACSELKKHRDWLTPLKRNVDDRVLLDIAHTEQANPGVSDNVRRAWQESVGLQRDEAPSSVPSKNRLSDTAVLTKVANMAYRGKAAAAALRRLRSKLPKRDKNSEFDPLHLWWLKRWKKFLEPGGVMHGLERFRRRRPEN